MVTHQECLDLVFFCHTQWCKQNISKSNLCRNRMYNFERLVVDAITQVLKLEDIFYPLFSMY